MKLGSLTDTEQAVGKIKGEDRPCVWENQIDRSRQG